MVLSIALLTACAEPPGDDSAVRLVDLFPQATISSTSTEAAQAEDTAADLADWHFAGEADPDAPHAVSRGWQAEDGVADLSVRGERLTGRTTSDYPVIRVERTSGLDHRDLLHAVELRMKVSAGSEVWMTIADDEDPDWQRVMARARLFPWPAKADLEPGDEVRTYLLKSQSDAPSPDIRHLLIRPTDAAGADFEIESVRLVFRNQHLASQPASIGWHGARGAADRAVHGGGLPGATPGD